MCRDVNAAAVIWCIHHLQQLRLKPPELIDSFWIKEFSHLCQLDFPRGNESGERISQFMSVMRFSLPLLGLQKCVAGCAGICYKSLSGTAGVTGSMKTRMRMF